MLNIMQNIKSFWRREDGVVATEAAIILPLLFWALAAMAIYFDAVRTKSAAVKATYTISDMLSRETNAITPAFLDNSLTLFEHMTNAPISDTDDYASLRISVVTWNEDEAEYELEWTQVRGDHFPVLDLENVSDLPDILPAMADQDTIILVETHMPYYQPFEFAGNAENADQFQIGLGGTGVGSFTFTRPRYAPQLIYSAG